MSVQIVRRTGAADRAQRHRPCLGWLMAGWVIAGTLWAATGLAAEAGVPSRFLEGLRLRGLHDEAIHYLDRARDDPTIPAAFKETIDYEAGLTLVEACGTAEDASAREAKLSRARRRFERFLAGHPEHARAFDAATRLGNVLIELGRMRLAQARGPSRTPDEKAALSNDARELMANAEQAFEEAETRAYARAKALREEAEQDPTKTDQRDQAYRHLLQARLYLLAVPGEIGRTYEPGSEEFNKHLREAAERYHAFHDKYKAYSAGLYARTCEAACLKDLGELQKALRICAESLEVLAIAGTPLPVKDEVLNLASALLASPDLQPYESAESAEPTRHLAADPMAMKYLIARVHLGVAKQWAVQDPGREEHLQKARSLLHAVAQQPGEYQEKAETLLEDPLLILPTEAVEETQGPGVPVPRADRRVWIARTCPARTEGVVHGALDWLASHQLPDGGWSFDHGQAPECQGQCRNPGQLSEARNAATGLALLALLGAGSSHTRGPFKPNVKAGLDFLVERMKETEHGGSFHESGGTMYSQGIAALALCEAYAMTADKGLHPPAQKAVDFIVYAQDPVGGGWRYQPRQKGDLSVTGWQLTALKSGHFGYLRVPPVTLKKASQFLDIVQADEGARYGYTQPGYRASTTAVGLLMRMYLGWQKDNPALKRGVEWLGEEGPSKTNLYYNYYATRLMHQVGDEPWQKWNAEMRDYLVDTQSQEGHEKGSWYLIGAGHSAERGGRLYSTAMAVMILEVYYRHLPIYSRPSDRKRLRETHPGLIPDEEWTFPE